jgi:hypothetical protein
VSLAIAKGLVLPKGSRFSIGAVPAAIAGVAPTLDFRPALERREIEAVSLTDKLTFTGGNEGTFVGSDGFIQRAQTNVPRFTHDPVTRRSLGLLAEEQKTNLAIRSEDFANASWTGATVTRTNNVIIAPNGTLTGGKISKTSGASLVITNVLNLANITAAAGTYTWTIYSKIGEFNRIGMRIRDEASTANWVAVVFNLTNGTIATAAANGGTFTGAAAESAPSNDGWYRYILTGTTTGATALRAQISDMDSVATTGDGTSGIFVWGAHLNPGPLTSYTPTTTAAVTRTADSAVLDGTGVITGTYTMVEKPAGCAVVSGTNINLQTGYTVERVMIFPATLTAGQITAIRAAM